MPPPSILLISCDAEIERAAAAAARKIGIPLSVIRTAHEAVKQLSLGCDAFGLILVDLDPAMHGVTLFNALDDVHGAAPIIALTDCEETYMTPIAVARGAAACLGKPVTPLCFEKLFAQFCHFSVTG